MRIHEPENAIQARGGRSGGDGAWEDKGVCAGGTSGERWSAGPTGTICAVSSSGAGIWA